MITKFKDFLNEKKDYAYKKYMGDNLNYHRTQLPQFKDQDNLKKEIHDAFGDDVSIKEVKKKLEKLKPTESVISEGLIRKHMNSNNWKTRLYVISEDNHLIDGHHHWAVGLEYDPEHKVHCLKIDKTMDDLMDIYEKREDN